MDNLDSIDSRFRYAILAAKRAKQLVGGARKKIDMIAENPLTIAIEEIKQGKINFHILEEEEAIKFPPEEAEVTEEKIELNEIDRDLFFRTNASSGFDEDEEEDEDEDDIEDEDDDSDDYGDDYDDDDDDEMIYESDEDDD